MKIFSFSFIVYIVLLLTQPCQDMASSVAKCNSKNTEIANIKQTPDVDPQSDDCSPFCICSCCSLSAADHSAETYISKSIENVLIDTNPIEYSNRYSKAHQNSIWQPPKA